jgi:pimeloyl-ACP methyl ester carboxylesterase
MLHGWTLDRRLWRRQIADLPQHLGVPVRALAFDLRGHGRSGATRRHTATLAQLADDLAAVVRKRVPHGKVVLVGHSMGGMTVLEYAYRHGADFAERVAGVVLVNTSAEGASHTDYGLTPRLARMLRVLERTGAGLLARSGPWRPHRFAMPALSPAVRWLVFGARPPAEALRLTAAMISTASLSAIGGFRPSIETHHRVEALDSMCELPVSVLVGSDDRLTPRRCAETIAEKVSCAMLHVLDGAGHMLPLERPEAVTTAIADVCRRALDAVTGAEPGGRAGAGSTADPEAEATPAAA